MQSFIGARVLGLGIIAALAGCGGDGSSQSAPATSSSPAADSGSTTIDPCALVTQAEAGEALGAS